MRKLVEVKSETPMEESSSSLYFSLSFSLFSSGCTERGLVLLVWAHMNVNE